MEDKNINLFNNADDTKRINYITLYELKKNKLNNFNVVKIIEDINNPYFRAKDILKILNYNGEKKTINNLISRIDTDFKKTLKEINEENKYNLLYTYNEGKEIYFNKEGLKYFLLKSKKMTPNLFDEINKIDFIKKLNLNLYNTVYISKENNYIEEIINFFSDIKSIKQYKVNKYFVDLYFPEYNLIIECDEFNHSGYDLEKELEREYYIKKKLNCKFIRFNPDYKHFNILNVIKEINQYIINELKIINLLNNFKI